jgi:hypothetical protein
MSLPRVVIDLEKLRHINCGLGRYSLHLGQEILAAAEGRFQPVFLLPSGAERYFPAGGFESITVSPWNKEAVRQLYRPLLKPFFSDPRVALWDVTSQMSKYLPLDDRVPVVLTIHDLNFLHESPADGRSEEIDRKLADIQRKVNRAAAIVAAERKVVDADICFSEGCVLPLDLMLFVFSAAISTLAPSMVPMMRPPFMANFMLLVPLASMPAVEMCWLRSEAGTMISARLTL